jgi:hypothetical protein
VGGAATVVNCRKVPIPSFGFRDVREDQPPPKRRGN